MTAATHRIRFIRFLYTASRGGPIILYVYNVRPDDKNYDFRSSGLRRPRAPAPEFTNVYFGHSSLSPPFHHHHNRCRTFFFASHYLFCMSRFLYCRTRWGGGGGGEIYYNLLIRKTDCVRNSAVCTRHHVCRKSKCTQNIPPPNEMAKSAELAKELRMGMNTTPDEFGQELRQRKTGVPRIRTKKTA